MSDDELFGLIFELSAKGQFNGETIRVSNGGQLEQKLSWLDEQNIRNELEEVIDIKGTCLPESDVGLALDYLNFEYSLLTKLAQEYITLAEKQEKRGNRDRDYMKAKWYLYRGYNDLKLTAYIVSPSESGRELIIEMASIVRKTMLFDIYCECGVLYTKTAPIFLEADIFLRAGDVVGYHTTLRELVGIVPNFDPNE